MIEFLPAPDHVAALRMSGKVTGEDFDKVTGELEAKLGRHDRIGVFVDMTGFDGITAEALAKDLRYTLSKLGEWRRFPREAVVTDRHWMASLMKVADPLIPQVEARVFAPGEQAAALAWAADIGAPRS